MEGNGPTKAARNGDLYEGEAAAPYAPRWEVPDRRQGIVDGSQGTGPSDREPFLQAVRVIIRGQAFPHSDQRVSLRGKTSA